MSYTRSGSGNMHSVPPTPSAIVQDGGGPRPFTFGVQEDSRGPGSFMGVRQQPENFTLSNLCQISSKRKDRDDVGHVPKVRVIETRNNYASALFLSADGCADFELPGQSFGE